jgi:hypothetical protein
MVSSLLASLRVKMFMPHPSETDMVGKPGWEPAGPEQRAQLDGVAEKFLVGLRVGLEGVPNDEIVARLGEVDTTFRGFSYEGCAMGLAVTDSVSLRPRRLREFLDGPGAPHVYMAYIGIGWGMARIPKMRWRAVAPRDPLLRWLALDGYGFHQAFFDTERWVTNHWRPVRYPAWPDDVPYSHNAVDQGIGRALWFVNGANAGAVAACIGRYEESRHADLWSGAGLASVYAGGVDVSELARFGDLAGHYRPEVAQGAMFAAKTRHMTDLVIPHTELAVKTHTGMTVAEAAATVDEIHRGLPPEGEVPAYEVWRQRLAGLFR